MPCTLEGCGRPAPDRWVNEILKLYQDCKERGALPVVGGVMDQPAEIMAWFRVLDEMVAAHRKKVAQENGRASRV